MRIFVNATVSSTFGDKSPAWPQRAIHSGNHQVRTLNPVQHGITKYGVELFRVRQVFAADHVRVHTGDYFTSKIDEFFRQDPVASATR
jgi:hypothetical protein